MHFCFALIISQYYVTGGEFKAIITISQSSGKTLVMFAFTDSIMKPAVSVFAAVERKRRKETPRLGSLSISREAAGFSSMETSHFLSGRFHASSRSYHLPVLSCFSGHNLRFGGMSRLKIACLMPWSSVGLKNRSARAMLAPAKPFLMRRRILTAPFTPTGKFQTAPSPGVMSGLRRSRTFLSGLSGCSTSLAPGHRSLQCPP